MQGPPSWDLPAVCTPFTQPHLTNPTLCGTVVLRGQGTGFENNKSSETAAFVTKTVASFWRKRMFFMLAKSHVSVCVCVCGHVTPQLARLRV